MNETRLEALKAALNLEHHGNVATLLANAQHIEEYLKGMK